MSDDKDAQLTEEDIALLKEIAEKERHLRWLGKTIRVIALWLTSVIFAGIALWNVFSDFVKHAAGK